jgi:hypothetical protein
MDTNIPETWVDYHASGDGAIGQGGFIVDGMDGMDGMDGSI